MKRVTVLLFLFYSSVYVFCIGSKIRINQLGYLPNGNKTAVLISESTLKIQEFSIHDALTDENCASFKSIISWGSFDKFNSIYILDFSSFKEEGAFYIKVGNTYSPNVYINKNIYINTVDHLIKYIRSQRFGGDISGGWWYDASNKNRSASVNASITYQLLYTYELYPEIFTDAFNVSGVEHLNSIPDIIDEIKWGLDWLSKINYESTNMSVAAKLVAVFSKSSDLLKNYYPDFADALGKKAVDIYRFAQAKEEKFKIPSVINDSYESENWTNDMQLAASQLYLTTYDYTYLQDALKYGAYAPVPQWLFTNCDKPLQFYPYINWSPFLLMQIENPKIKAIYRQNLNIALQRAYLTANENPFKIGIHLSGNSNNKIVALHNLCHAYRILTHDEKFKLMEDALFDWIFGCNPWGISMVTKIPENGISPLHPHTKQYIEKDEIAVGALINGPVSALCMKGSENENQTFDGFYELYQTEWGIYHDHVNDYITNQPNIDGTAALIHLMATRQAHGEKKDFFDRNIYDRGGINQFNPNKKQIAIIFTGHQYNDGFNKISTVLKKHHIKAAFFFSGDFLKKPGNAVKIKKLKKSGHYIGPATNHYQQLVDWTGKELYYKKKEAFFNDLKENYALLKKCGIDKQQAPFFNPPFELYNDSISKWCKDAGIYLVRSTPGTYSNLDYTTPEMREHYVSSQAIIDKIIEINATTGLNGYILQFNFGVSPGRKDKLYNSLPSLLNRLKNEGYEFVDLFTATDLLGGKRDSNPRPSEPQSDALTN